MTQTTTSSYIDYASRVEAIQEEIKNIFCEMEQELSQLWNDNTQKMMNDLFDVSNRVIEKVARTNEFASEINMIDEAASEVRSIFGTFLPE